MNAGDIFRQGKRFPALVLLIISMLSAAGLSAESRQDFNEYYKFPVSVGVEFQNITPFDAYRLNFTVYEISASLRIPVPSLPVLQPFLKGGIIRFDSIDADNPQTWDHNHFFGGIGTVFSSRFSGNFELGADIMAGFSEAVFPSLVPETGPLGSANLVFEAGGEICLDPSFNFSIQVHPAVKYLHSLSVLSDFNGFSFGIGFAAHYRFGKDPDSPASVIRSLQAGKISLERCFAAMQSYYVNNPAGTLVLTNTDKQDITELEVYFFQQGFMDGPTRCGSYDILSDGDSVEIGLLASYNRNIFTTEGITPLTGEVITQYKLNGRPAEQRFPVSYDLYDKTALLWDDNRKVGAFITPADSALRNYISYIRRTCREETIETYNQQIQTAMQVFNALGLLGCLYQSDPTSPFTKAQGNISLVDSISLPRDTLKRITGDCDDLTVLFCSLLESAGIETAYITTPGHIFTAFNTRVPSADFRKLYPDRELLITAEGELWIPVEITMIGKDSFLNAWRKGMEEYSAMNSNPAGRGFYQVKKVQEQFRPVGLKETDLGLQYGSSEVLAERFRKDLSANSDFIAADLARAAQKSGLKTDYNRLGIVCAELERYKEASEAFSRAVSLDSDYISAKLNLANVKFLTGDYEHASESFLELEQQMIRKNKDSGSLFAKILVNAARSFYALSEFKSAEEYFKKAVAADPGLEELHPDIAAAYGTGETRAAEVPAGSGLLFADEE